LTIEVKILFLGIEDESLDDVERYGEPSEAESASECYKFSEERILTGRLERGI
jgi:hypothetical protein